MSTVGRINPAQAKHLIVFLGNEQNDKLEIIVLHTAQHHEVTTSGATGLVLESPGSLGVLSAACGVQGAWVPKDVLPINERGD